MKIRGHIKILVLVTIVWALFWLLGLPDYYQQYTDLWMLVFDIGILIPITVFVIWLLNRTPKKYRVSMSLWLAFYITVPVFIFDYLYCGLYLGYGLSFLIKYWYISVYYIIPWILCPLAGAYVSYKNNESV